MFLFILVWFFFLIFQAETSLFLFHLIAENLILHIFLIIAFDEVERKPNFVA